MKTTISLKNFAFFQTSNEEIKSKQEQLDSITNKLTDQDIADLENIFSWIALESVNEHEFNLND